MEDQRVRVPISDGADRYVCGILTARVAVSENAMRVLFLPGLAAR
jgi:hypothetical protein